MSNSSNAPGSIKYRNRDGTIEAQSQLWRGLCDKPQTIRKYITTDAVMADTTNKLYTPESEPNLQEYLDTKFDPWTAYRIHDDPEFIEIDMMSSALIYKVTAWRQEDNGNMVPTELMCTSIWRQGAGGEWKCCLHQMTSTNGGQ